MRDLKTLLNDRYRDNDGGVAILKELIQNADDAGAKSLHVAFCGAADVPAGTNPLCSRPGILIVNDAPFEKRHEQAFTSFSTSSKDSEEAQIGRFGIGRKSLFHWAEVVFYLGHGEDGVFRGGVINPWADLVPIEEGSNTSVWRDGRNPDWIRWDKGGNEEAFLRARAEQLLGADSTRPWFAIWLPSRNEDDEGRALSRVRTSRETLPMTRTRLDAVARLMPQLASVERITLHVVEVPPNQTLAVTARGTLVRDGHGLGRPGPGYSGSEGGSAGIVKAELASGTGPPESWSLHYDIVERLVETPEMTALRSHENWPTEPPENLQDPDATAQPAKAAPHGGATVVIGPTGPDELGELSIQNAIFLPLSGASAAERGDLARRLRVSMLLHGYQFPDSGRQRVEGSREILEREPDSAPGVRARWNRLVNAHATLPNVLQVLHSALTREEVPPDDARAIVDAINRSRLVTEHRAELTAERQLLLGPAMERPSLVPAARRCLSVPGAESSDVLGALSEVGREMAGRFALVWRESPGLASSGQPSQWSTIDVQAFGDRIKRYFADDPLAWLTWFEAWAQGLRNETADAVGAIALELYRASILHKNWRRLLTHAAWRGLARVFLAGRVASLWPSLKAIEYLRTLHGADGSKLTSSWPVIVLPPAHLPDGREAPGIEPSVILDALVHLSEGEDDPGRSDFVAALLKVVDRRAVLRDPRIASKRFVSVSSTDDQTALISLSELQSASDEARAFTNKGVLRAPELARLLSNALAGAPTIHVVKDSVIAEALDIPSMADDAIPGAVLRHRVVLEPEPRLRLLERVLMNASGGLLDVGAASPLQVRAARRLIAGPEMPEAAKEPLLRPDGVSFALCEQIIARSWQAIPARIATFLAEKLSLEWLRMLGVEKFDTRTVVARMGDPSSLERLQVLASSYPTLLEELAALLVEDSLFGKLPIHRTKSGTFVALEDGEIFRPSMVPVPPGLSARVQFIAIPAHEKVAGRLQREVPEWSARALLKLALETPDVQAVFDALGHLGHLTQHDEKLVRDTPWLPLCDGRLVAPGKVFSLSAEIEDRLGRLPGRSDSDTVSVRDVAPRWLNQANWRTVQQLMPAGAVAIRQTFERLCAREELLPSLRVCGELQQLSGVVGEKLVHEPVLSFWEGVLLEFPDENFESDFQHFISGPITADRALQVLRLVSAGDLPAATLSANELSWFAYSLQALAHGRGAGKVPPEAVRGLWLPNADGNLTPSENVIQSGDALPPGRILHDSVSQLFHVPLLPVGADARGRGVATLESILSPWSDGKTSRELLGLLIAPFALRDGFDTEDLGALFRRLRPGYTPEDDIQDLLSLCATRNDRDDSSVARARWGRYRFQEIREGDGVEFTSVTGHRLIVNVERPRKQMFVDPPSIEFLPRRDDAPPIVIRMWALDPEAAPADREKMILSAIEALLQGMFQRRPLRDRLSARFKLAVQESQELRLAQALLIDLLPPSLRRLGLHKRHAALGAKLVELDRKRQELEKMRLQKETDLRHSQPLRDAEKQLEAARHELQALIERDDGAQAMVLGALRDEIHKYQYQADQVLFELAQNADDAYTQRMSVAETPAARSFSVEVTDNRIIRVRHDGRPINRCYIDEDRDRRGWDRDLINMLSLGFSEKGEGDTGRFGLGFKSVYLISDAPRLQSERLELRISGGVLPLPVPEFERDTSGALGTMFELPIREGVEPEDVLARFRRLAALLPLFAQSIRRVEISQDERRIGLEPRVVSTLADPAGELEVVCVDVPSTAPRDGGDVGGRWLLFREPQDDERPKGPQRLVALRILGGRFVPTDGIPSLWVTVPTREEFSLGFLIGGPVGIDVGRSRLARESAQTAEVLQRLVKLVHSGIILLADAVGRSPAPWNAPFGDGASPAMVLGSLFEVLTSSILHPAAAAAWEHEVVRGLLGHGFLDRVAIVPDATGTLRRVSELDRCLDDELAAPFVRDLIQKRFPWEAVAVEPGVSERLKGLRYGATLKPLSVLDAVSRIYPEASRLETSAATHILVLKQLKDKVRDETWSALKGHLSGCSLKARGGAWCLIRDLLLARSEDDDATEEALLFGFAPDARRLPMDSPDDVVELVALFRRRAKIRFEEILQWARSASNDEAREAVVRYMFDGRHDTDLTDALFDDRPAWLTDELIQKVGKKLGKSANVVDSKRVATGTTSLAATPSDPRRAEPSLSPSSLDNILEWWRRDGSSREKTYMKAAYPPAWRDAARLRDALQGGDRKAWSVLCVLAMCQRLGRSRPEQHRVFMERHPAWIDVLAAEDSTSDDWIRLIDDWISAQEVSEEYSHWLGLYPSFRRLWRVSRELYPLLRTSPPPDLPPDRLFSFRDNPALSGTGVVLPRFSRAFGDRGRAWLCRELVRLGVWEFKRSQRYYVPWRIMCQIVDVPEGADAAAIAEGLEQHLGDPVPFGRVFDLPFDILRFDKSLRAELLDVEDDDDSAFADDDDAVESGEP